MKKIIALMLICCMVLPMIPTLAAEQGSDDYNFSIIQYLSAGDTTYLRITAHNWSGQGSVTFRIN